MNTPNVLEYILWMAMVIAIYYFTFYLIFVKTGLWKGYPKFVHSLVSPLKVQLLWIVAGFAFGLWFGANLQLDAGSTVRLTIAYGLLFITINYILWMIGKPIWQKQIDWLFAHWRIIWFALGMWIAFQSFNPQQIPPVQ